MFKYFKRGGLAFGSYFTLSQGIDFVLSKVLSFIVKRSVHSAGVGFRIQRGSYVDCPKNLRFGDRCQIGRYVIFGTELETGSLECGADVQINEEVRIDYSGGIVIEDHVTISSRTVIYTHDHGLDPRSTPKAMPLRIGERAWIGSGAIVLGKVEKIGARAIVAAGSVVTKEVPPDVVVGGNPAKVIRHL